MQDLLYNLLSDNGTDSKEIVNEQDDEKDANEGLTHANLFMYGQFD